MRVLHQQSAWRNLMAWTMKGTAPWGLLPFTSSLYAVGFGALGRGWSSSEGSRRALYC